MRRSTLLVVLVLAVFVAVGAYLIFGRPSRPAQARTFDVNVKGSTMSPSHLQAYQGDTVTLSVGADKSEEIHLHGYDKHFLPAPGKRASQTFVADKTGKFDIEIEASSTLLGELDVNPR